MFHESIYRYYIPLPKVKIFKIENNEYIYNLSLIICH